MPKNTTAELDIALRNLTRKDKLALADKLCEAAKARLASGKDVTQENIAILNRARAVLKTAKL